MNATKPLPLEVRARLLDQLYASKLFQEPKSAQEAGGGRSCDAPGPDTRKAA